MALSNCRECDGQVAESAVMCPHCGAASEEMLERRVVIENVDMSPMQWVNVMLWIFVASIPAAFMTAVCGLFLLSCFGGAISGLGSGM